MTRFSVSRRGLLQAAGVAACVAHPGERDDVDSGFHLFAPFCWDPYPTMARTADQVLNESAIGRRIRTGPRALAMSVT